MVLLTEVSNIYFANFFFADFHNNSKLPYWDIQEHGGTRISEKLEAENIVSDLYKYDVAYVMYVASPKPKSSVKNSCNVEFKKLTQLSFFFTTCRVEVSFKLRLLRKFITF
jgi:hypothetical protein